MTKQKFSLKNAEQVRRTTTMQMQKEIKQMYEQLYKDVSRKIKQIGNKGVQKQNLILLQREIKRRIEQINKDLQSGIIRSMNTVCIEVVKDKREFLKQCGFKDEEIKNAFYYIPERVVNNILKGHIYQSDWTLSSTIWGYNKQVQDKINKIISIGVAQGKSAKEIAGNLEQYVNPSKRKQSKTIQSWRYDKNGNKIKDSVYFGKIDYNAMRLARTLISHAYQQSFESVNRNDPFVTGYRWLTSNFHGRVCDICKDREGKIFAKDELPLDHPNGMCTFEAVIPYDMKDIAKKIGEWYLNPVGTFPDLDRYALDFME